VANHRVAHLRRYDEAGAGRHRLAGGQKVDHQAPGAGSPATANDGRELRRGPQSRISRQHEAWVCAGAQADSSSRPLRRRADRIARPARVRMRRRKPWTFARRRLFGWNVRLLKVISPRLELQDYLLRRWAWNSRNRQLFHRLQRRPHPNCHARSRPEGRRIDHTVHRANGMQQLGTVRACHQGRDSWPRGSNQPARDGRDTPGEMLALHRHLVGTAAELLAFHGHDPAAACGSHPGLAP
jgi:hypothetical protein